MSDWHPDDIVRLASARNSVEANIWKQALEDEGIRAKVVGDSLEVGFGDLVGMTPEVWVFKSDLDRATKILKEHGQGPKSDEEE